MNQITDLFHALINAIEKLKAHNLTLQKGIVPTHTPQDGQLREQTVALHTESDAVVEASKCRQPKRQRLHRPNPSNLQQ
jgi:hypothetical protein